MNLPNKLTVLRVIMIPAFIAAYLVEGFFLALVLFVVACLTDMLDGMIARKWNLVTNFGALMDPLADKLLVMAAILCFLHSRLVHVVVVIVLLAREFLVTSIRLVAAGKGIVIAADKWGKLKTVFQMIWIGVGLLVLWREALPQVILPQVFDPHGDLTVIGPGYAYGPTAMFYTPWLWWVYSTLTVLVLVATVLSGLNYLVRNRHLFNDA